jgi:hypothetical protein
MQPPGTKGARLVLIPFRCGRNDCPVCSQIKRSRLVRRLKGAPWPDSVYMWTVTTDPSILSSDEALRSISVRWHHVLRNLRRHYPQLRYFRVIELTKSGLPHMHILFDQYVDWHLFRKALMRADFGRVLHFKKLPKAAAITYLTKYVTKSLHEVPYLRQLRLRTWAASIHFLPVINYFEEGTEFTPLWIGPVNFTIQEMLPFLMQETGLKLDAPTAPT